LDNGVLKEDKTMGVPIMDNPPPPKKVGEIIVPIVPVPPRESTQTIDIQSLNELTPPPEQCGTMWNNDCSGPK
jgi:hypothetical protein